MKPAAIQTETDEDTFLISQENDKLKREVDQLRSDLSQLLDSYEARKMENLNLRETVDAVSSSLARVERENIVVMKDLE